MKYFFLSIALLWSIASFAQSPCFCRVELVPQNDCCVNIVASWSPTCGAGQAAANHLRINTAFAPPFTANIQSFTLAYPQLSGTLSAGNTVLDINASVNIASLQPIGDQIILGAICYENVNSTVVTNDIAMDNNGISSCTGASEVPITCVPAQPWNKIYGDSLANRPNKVKAFGDGVYVVGSLSQNNTVYATLSKFDITNGNLIWHFQHDVPSVFYDVEYSPLSQEVIVVGATEAIPLGGAAFDNKSLIMRRRASDGSLPTAGLKEYDHPGREFFEVIKRHPTPQDPNFPFYVLGRANPASNAPSGFDQVIAYNFNRNLSARWNKRYEENSGIEIEGYRGIVPLSDGHLLLLGNGSIANEGAVIKVDGEKGDWLDAWYHPDGIDWYDGVQLPSGIVILSGTRFSSDQAIVMAVNPSNMAPLAGMIFQNQSNFEEIGWHHPAGNTAITELYLLSREKNNAPNRNILNKLTFTSHPAVGPTFTLNYSRYVEDNELAFNNPHLYVVPSREAIFYADSRLPNPTIYGDEDMLLGVYDLNFSSDCAQNIPSPTQGYSVMPTNLDMFSTSMNLIPIDQGTQNPILAYQCTNFCSNCTADFTWFSDCCELQLLGSGNGSGPYIYEWDFLCDGTIDATGASATLTNLPLGPNVLCLKITDATGCIATIQKTVTIVGDNTPPVINCPNDTTLFTDIGECFATYSIPIPSASDNCDDSLHVSCFLTGAITTPITPVNALPKGTTIVNCAVEDDKGNLANCRYNITVVDNEPPSISCPAPINATAAGCAGGTTVSFPQAVFDDNCPMVTYVCSHQSDDFFPCGTTMVTCTATDMAGNQTSCTFPITVDCSCAEVGPGSLECTDIDDQFAFSIQVNDLAGAGPNACAISVSSSQTGVSISNVVVSGGGPAYVVTGLIDISAPPVPNTINIQVDVLCTCPDGSTHDCSFTRTLATPCCKQISLDPQEVCKTASSVQIPLLGCNQLYDVQQVRWYISDAPCSSGTWTEIQVTNGCSPLSLSPEFHDNDICVYAEVDMGPGGGPCSMLRSDTVTITLCEAVGCVLSSNQEYCYTGSPITAMPLTVDVDTAACGYIVEWFDTNGNPLNLPSNQLSYQPPALSFTGSPDDCYQDYTYFVRVSFDSGCPPTNCQATIRLYNEDAPLGNLVMLPPDVNPLCYGEDAILEYSPECAGDPERWQWFIRPDVNPTYTPLTNNGDRNPLYYTNRLYEDTWVKVEKTNGVCPSDEIEIFLDIIEPLSISNFTAKHSPPCSPNAVELELDFTPSPAPAGCTYTIYWYKGRTIIHTSTHTSASAAYTYIPPTSLGLAGNYYCIIESDCCPGKVKSPVVSIQPPMEVYATGPCFRCKCDTIQLEGIVLYSPAGFSCTYQWYDNGVPIPGETNLSLSVAPSWDGPFTFEVSCSDGITSCMLSDTYTLLQCGSRDSCIVSTQEFVHLNAVLYPSPSSGMIHIDLDQATSFPTIEVFDAVGSRVLILNKAEMNTHFAIDLSSLPAGAYFIRAFSTNRELLLQKIIKQ